jgi:hypothetical protein
MVSEEKNQNICRNKRLFLEKYPEYGSVGATLKSIGVKRRATFYDWCDADPKFKAFYETELLPNRRDAVASIVYRMATAHKNVAICPVCEGTGKCDTKNCHGCHRGLWFPEGHRPSGQAGKI